MLEKVLNCSSLPTLPSVAVELLELTRDPETALEDIGALVEKDQALASKILRTVNSSYYGLAQPCPTIRRALTYMGLNTVKSLALGFSLVDVSSRTPDGFDLTDYWRRSLFSAAAARRIAIMTATCDPDEAFLAALLQDIGMLAIHTALGKSYRGVLARSDNDHLLLPDLERESLGFTHAEAGARLGERWHLPGQIVTPIRYHHLETEEGAARDALVRTVALALQVATLPAAADRLATFRRLDAMSRRLFGITTPTERALLQATFQDARELAGLLEVNVGEPPNVGAILADAEEARIRHTFAVQREAEQLREDRAELAREALTDGLTGVGNRKSFDQQLEAGFRAALDRGSALALILADADRFKRVNDSLGHPAGDAVLREMARRLRERAPRNSVLCRYGGEEFALLLPGVSRPEAGRIAERLRQAVEAEPFRLTGPERAQERIQVTASFGVAVLEPQIATVLRRPALLVQLADKALYAAKQAGRNCVRVFTPTRVSDAA